MKIYLLWYRNVIIKEFFLFEQRVSTRIEICQPENMLNYKKWNRPLQIRRVSLCCTIVINASYAELIDSLSSCVRAYVERASLVRSSNPVASYRRVARLSASGFAHDNWAHSGSCRVKTTSLTRQ